MNIGLSVVQALLGLAFAGSGGMKVFAYNRFKAASEKNGPSGITHSLATLIGIAELAGAIGLILPMALHIAPWLTALAAMGLALIMLLAIVYHLRRREPPTPAAVLFTLSVFVAFGRFAHWA